MLAYSYCPVIESSSPLTSVLFCPVSESSSSPLTSVFILSCQRDIVTTYQCVHTVLWVCFRLAQWVPMDRGECPSIGKIIRTCSKWERPPSGLCPRQMHLPLSRWPRYGAALVQSTSMWTALGRCPSCRSSPPTLGWTPPPCPRALPPLSREVDTPSACPVGPTSAPPPWAAVVSAVGAAWAAAAELAAEWYRRNRQNHRHSRTRQGVGEEGPEEEESGEWSQGTATPPSSVQSAGSAAAQPARSRGSCPPGGAAGTATSWVPAGLWTCAPASVAFRLRSTTVGQRRTTRATMTHARAGAASAARAGRVWLLQPCSFHVYGVSGRCGGAWQPRQRVTTAAVRKAASVQGGPQTRPRTLRKRDAC